jgi:hypothetical protein
MSNGTLATYRLPIPTSTQIGRLRVVIDRNRRVYAAGSPVVSATPSGEFLILTLANDQVYYVKAHEYQALQLQAPQRRRR